MCRHSAGERGGLLAELAPSGGEAPGQSRHRPLFSALRLALGAAVAVGLARFAYSLLLPAMRADLGWSLAQAGAVNSANAVGYVLGAVVARSLVARAGARRTYVWSMAATALALLASAAISDFGALLTLRFVAGFTGALVFVAGAALVSQLATDYVPAHPSRVLGAYFAGGGLGIVFSAVSVPPVLALGSGGSWRWGWVVLGGASLAALAAAAPVALRSSEPAQQPPRRLPGSPMRRLVPTVVSYGLFGAGYIAYITFIVAFLKDQGFASTAVGAFWAVLGCSAVVAAFAWGPILDRLHGGRGPATVLSVASIGALLPLVAPGVPGDFASAVLFGGAFLAVVTAVMNLVRRTLSPWQVPSAIAGLTAVFGTGQSIGPLLAGALSDGSSGLRTGLALGAGLLVVATVVATTQRVVPVTKATLSGGPAAQRPRPREAEDARSL